MSPRFLAALLGGILALALAPAVCAQTVPFAASGTLLDGAGMPVPCCEVEVQVRTMDGNVFSQDLARTRGDGSFRADSLACQPGVELVVVAVPRCCSGESAPIDITDCIDPNTGAPLEDLSLGELTCSDDAVTNRTLLSGRTVCRDGVFLEPVADCAIHLLPVDLGAPGAFTWTAADGTWELCAECESAVPPVVRVVEAQCCDLQETVDLTGCPERLEVSNFVCDPCPEPPCTVPRDIEVRGRVICPIGAGGGEEPIAGCRVSVLAFNDCMEQVGPFEVLTEASLPEGCGRAT